MRVDVLVIGAGPVGLETAAVLQAEGHRVVVVDAGPIGATIARTFPPQTRFFTSPERLAIRGWPVPSTTGEKTTGEEYLAYLRALVTGLGVRVRTFTTVIGVAGLAGDFKVTMTDNWGRTTDVACSTVVVATGGTDRPRTLGAPGEDLPGVHRCLGDPHRFFGRTVAVVGGRNSAAESALRLYRVGARVHLIHRGWKLNPRVKHWIRPEVESLLDEDQLHRHMPTEVVRIEPGRIVLQPLLEVPQDDGAPTDVRPAGDEPAAEYGVDVDDVLLQIGYAQDPHIFDLVGIPLVGVQRAPQHDPDTMESAVPGIFVVGTATAGTQSKFAV
ncbi:MAG: hypothetical protein RLZ55_1410, partial [Actinomycetota bacterium]